MVVECDKYREWGSVSVVWAAIVGGEVGCAFCARYWPLIKIYDLYMVRALSHYA